MVFGKIQLHTVSCRIFKEQLNPASQRHASCLELDIVLVQSSFHLLSFGTGECHVIKSGCDMGKAYFAWVRLTQVEHVLSAGVEPVARAFQQRSLTLFKTYHLTVEFFENIQEFTRCAQIVMIKTYRSHVDSRWL